MSFCRVKPGVLDICILSYFICAAIWLMCSYYDTLTIIVCRMIQKLLLSDEIHIINAVSMKPTVDLQFTRHFDSYILTTFDFAALLEIVLKFCLNK